MGILLSPTAWTAGSANLQCRLAVYGGLLGLSADCDRTERLRRRCSYLSGIELKLEGGQVVGWQPGTFPYQDAEIFARVLRLPVVPYSAYGNPTSSLTHLAGIYVNSDHVSIARPKCIWPQKTTINIVLIEFTSVACGSPASYSSRIIDTVNPSVLTTKIFHSVKPPQTELV